MSRLKIKNIIINYPELVSDNFIENVKTKYNEFCNKEDLLAEARITVRKLEEEVNKLNDDFTKITNNICTIEFEKPTYKAPIMCDTPFYVANRSDARNKNYKL